MALFLDCPHGIKAGEGYTITASGSDCRDAVNLNWTWTPLPGGMTAVDNNNQLTITTQTVANGGAAPSSITVTVECTGPDGVVHTEQCILSVYSDEFFIVTETSEPLCQEFADCNIQCFCTEAEVTFDCVSDCFSESVTLVVEDCAQVAADKICPPEQSFSVNNAILGTKPAYIEEPECEDGCDCCEIDLDPHMPVAHWNSLCSCPTWTVTGAGINDTTAADSCSCNYGKPWVFGGTGTWSASGTIPANVDTVVIWGHNFVSGQITTDPIPPYIDPDTGSGGNPFNFEYCFDDACIGGFSRPIVIDLSKCCFVFRFIVESGVPVSTQISTTTGGSTPITNSDQVGAWLSGNGFSVLSTENQMQPDGSIRVFTTYESECLKYEDGLPFFGGISPTEQAYKAGGAALSVNGVQGSISSIESVSDPITNFNMTIDGVTVDGGPAIISHITVGEKFFFDDDGCGIRYTNPHNGTQCEFDIKESECGVLARSTREVMVPLQLDMEYVSENWMKLRYRALLRYLCDTGQPFLFQWSRNRCEGDLYYGFLDGVQSGSSYDGCYQNVSMSLKGYINQTQPKSFG